MKDIRPALRTLLLSDPTINGLVGGVRIHSSRLPQGQVDPSVVYTKISEAGDYVMRGDSGLGELRMQVDSWAQSNDSATQLANAVYDQLSGYKGRVNFDATFVDMRGSFVISGREDYDDVMQMFRVSRDYIIWYDVQ